MTRRHNLGHARPARLFAIVSLSLLLNSCGGRTAPKISVDGPGPHELGELWIEPRNLESSDLFHGAGGRALAPDPSAAYELVAIDNTGFSPGYDVRDRKGTEWNIKLGIEAQPELVASRVLWALGYHQPPTYVLTRWELVGKQSGTQGIARFRRESDDHRVITNWSWYENPFVMARPFKGLLVANLILNNWDWKTSNNKVYEIADGLERRRVYVVPDLGASLGKTTFPTFLAWTPFRRMAQGSRNDINDFEEQGFITGVEENRVKFDYHGTNAGLVNTLTVEDVVWTCRLMARLTDRQWHDAFRAAGYLDADRLRYITKLKSKIREGLALARSQSR